MKIVEIWAKGYADRDGLSILKIEDDADPVAAARQEFGNWATVYSVRPANPPKVEPVSEEYARMMSRNDNS
jgi:hypothetical protein